MTSNRTVVQVHAEEVSFLWLMRSQAVAANHSDLDSLARLDTRVAAHSDGLAIAGKLGWEIAARELAWKEPGEVFATGVLAFESGEAERIEAVLGVAAGDTKLARGAISALGWLEFETARPHVEALLADSDPMLRRLGVRAGAAHRWRASHLYEAALSTGESALLAAGLRAAGELGEAALLARCHAHLDSGEPDLRFWSAWSLGLCGERAALPIVQEVSGSRSPFAGSALDVGARLLDSSAARWWYAQLSEDGRLRTAIELVGRLGDPVFVPWLFEQMAAPELARVAGEAFTMITGVDLAFEDLESEWPEGFEAGPTEDPEDTNVSMDPDEDLPWPDPALVQRWWEQNQGRFRPGTRYLCGLPIEPANLQHVLRYGKQRQRIAAAIELKILQPNQPLFEWRAPGFRQQKWLGLK